MFLPAHLATGYVVGKGAGRWLGIPIALYSHFLLDHFWEKVWHGQPDAIQGSVIAVSSVLLLAFGWRQLPTMVAAAAPDAFWLWQWFGPQDWKVAHDLHWWLWFQLPNGSPWFSIGIQAGFALLIAAQIRRHHAKDKG